MSKKSYSAIVNIVLLGSGLAIAQNAPESTPPPAPQADSATGFEPYTGEVTTQSVNVRSGPSTNHYEVTKLNAGAKVKVLGREFNWLAIEPPEGVFSLVATSDLDLSEDGTGVVRADDVRVYAAPANSKKKKDDHHSHPKLNRGAVVKVVGTTDDGFVRIAPPPGSKLWISGDYVQTISAEELAREAELHLPKVITEDPATAVSSMTLTPTTEDSSTPPSVTPTVVESVADFTKPPTPAAAATQMPSTDPSPEIRAQLDEANTLLEQELAKPLRERDLAPLRSRFSPLADQSSDEYVRAFARTRIEQIDYAMELLAAVRQAGEISDRVREVRSESQAVRATLQALPLELREGFVVEGELRSSAIYDSPVGPQRYRLVDPLAAIPQTLAYVELAEGVQYDMTQFLGRRVGVKAKHRILQQGTSEAVPVYVAEELVLSELAPLGYSSAANP